MTITTFSILTRANGRRSVPQPVFPNRTGIGSISAKRFLRLSQSSRYFMVPKLAKSSRFSSSMQNQVGLYFDTSPRASPVARDLFPRLPGCAGWDRGTSDPSIFSNPGLRRFAPRGVSVAAPNADFSWKVSARRLSWRFPAEPECTPYPHVMGAMGYKRIFNQFRLFFLSLSRCPSCLGGALQLRSASSPLPAAALRPRTSYLPGL